MIISVGHFDQHGFTASNQRSSDGRRPPESFEDSSGISSHDYNDITSTPISYPRSGLTGLRAEREMMITMRRR